MNYLIKTTSRARFSTWAAISEIAESSSGLVLSWHFSIAYKGIKRKEKKTCMRGARQQGLGKEETASTACKFRKSRSTLTSLLYETYLASRLTYFSKSSCSDKLLWVVTTNLSLVDQHTVAKPNFLSDNFQSEIWDAETLLRHQDSETLRLFFEHKVLFWLSVTSIISQNLFWKVLLWKP